MATNPYRVNTADWRDWESKYNPSKATNYWAPVPGTEEKPYVFNPEDAFGASNDWLQQYQDALLPAPAEAPDSTKYLEDVGPYEAYDWQTAGDNLLAGYTPPEYQQADYVAAPEYEKVSYDPVAAYDPTQFDFADQYQAPDAYTAYNFTTPEVDQLSSVQPVSDEIWNAAMTEATDRVNEAYKGIRQRTRDEIIRTSRSPEQAAAIMANLDIEQEKAKRDEARKISIEKAQQGVGIAQQEQELGLQRSLAVASMDADTQAKMADELAKTYGMSTDAARYLVAQYADQQKAQNEENKFAYDQAVGEARYGAEFETGQNTTAQATAAAEAAREYAANDAANKYAYESGTESERYKSGLEQYTEEQKAAEAEKAWQSQYGQAQDLTQASMADWQAQQAANTDYWNSIMQGANAAQTGAAQEATYWTNLEKPERDEAEKAATTYKEYTPTGEATGNTAYGGAGKTTPATAAKTTTASKTQAAYT